MTNEEKPVVERAEEILRQTLITVLWQRGVIDTPPPSPTRLR
jgi:hypothetical protein